MIIFSRSSIVRSSSHTTFSRFTTWFPIRMKRKPFFYESENTIWHVVYRSKWSKSHSFSVMSFPSVLSNFNITDSNIVFNHFFKKSYIFCKFRFITPIYCKFKRLKLFFRDIVCGLDHKHYMLYFKLSENLFWLIKTFMKLLY